MKMEAMEEMDVATGGADMEETQKVFGKGDTKGWRSASMDLKVLIHLSTTLWNFSID